MLCLDNTQPVKVMERTETLQKRQSIRLEVEKQEKDPFEKFIEVSATQLANGDCTYISSDMIRNMSNNNNTAEMEAFLATLEDTSKPKVLESSVPQDLTSLISKMKQNVTANKGVDELSTKGSSSSLLKLGQVLARKPSLNDRPFSFAHPPPPASHSQMLPPSLPTSQQSSQQARNKFGASSSSVDAFSTKSWQPKVEAPSVSNSQSSLRLSQPSQIFSSSQQHVQREKEEKKRKSVTALKALLGIVHCYFHCFTTLLTRAFLF